MYHWTHLDKERDTVEPPDDGTVVLFPGEDVQGPDGSLHDLLHTNSVHVAGTLAVRADRCTLGRRDEYK